MLQTDQHVLPGDKKEHIPNLYEHFIAKNFITYMKMALGDRSRRSFLEIMNRPNRYIGRDAVERGEVSFENLRKYYEEKDWMLDRIDQLEVDLRIISRMAPYGAIQYIRKHIGYDEFLVEYAYKRKIKMGEVIKAFTFNFNAFHLLISHRQDACINFRLR